ncbi:hypothetical protein FUAX_24840 [Fulvitalea axinellae]|uniref:Glycosyl transferase family 1 domain-containing protein n=1 Tax=Fulvitalea axinellae TaxID=1182444 RepID=A0AAU9CSU3_9BACT|nr:hypothetical protein FUAX_24840 [Fulvitalea axinellae]
MSKRRILFVYDYFLPAYKAGGPIRSLANLTTLLSPYFDCYVYTSDQDLDGEILAVEKDRWVTFSENIKVFYSSKSFRNSGGIKTLVRDIMPEAVYLNGVFSLDFIVSPLRQLKKGGYSGRVVMAPRGMLRDSAFRLKWYKKIPFMFFLKSMGLLENVRWHATDEQEAVDILNKLKVPAHKILPNVPFFDIESKGSVVEDRGMDAIRFVSVSLIARMKNHLAFLNTLIRMPSYGKTIIYDIYGPIKESEYWEECQALIKKLPPHVRCTYKGAIQPSEVSDILKDYHFYVLPTLGENFGHAIFEAFNVGLPVMISDRTPWKELRTKDAGWDFPLEDPEALEAVLEEILEMDNKVYVSMRSGARKLAEDFMQAQDFVKMYSDLLLN